MSRTVLITGAASGIGLALARQCATEDTNVILVDLPGERLEGAERELSERSKRIYAYPADVGNATAVKDLAAAVHDRFDAVDLLFNNAGIGGLHRWSWTFSDAEWDAILTVNLRGVINGVNAFLPRMIERNEGHVVNTASMAGLIPTPMNGAYVTTKFGIVGFSETLAIDLAAYGSQVGISVVCPALVRTRIDAALVEKTIATMDEPQQNMNRGVSQGVAAGMDPDEAARIVLDGVREKQFYILTHPEALPLVGARMQAILDGGQPSFNA